MEANRTILFADVRDSTGITERLGDVGSRHLIGALMEELKATTVAHRGTVIKTIGDEVMSTFENPRDGVSAAVQMQRDLLARPPVDGVRPQVGIGVNAGSVVMEEADVFGDVVIVAARLVAIATSGQIITTGPTLEAIDDDGEILSRGLGEHLVKGREEPVDLREILWRGETAQMTTLAPKLAEAPRSSVELRLGTQVVRASSDIVHAVTLGRSDENSLFVGGTSASRRHAKITARGGRFHLVDHSTNGTYVRQSDGKEIVVHRDEVQLSGSGVIRLGDPITEAGPLDIAFAITGED